MTRNWLKGLAMLAPLVTIGLSGCGEGCGDGCCGMGTGGQVSGTPAIETAVEGKAPEVAAEPESSSAAPESPAASEPSEAE